MSFDRDLVAYHAPCARVVVAETRGSTPRETGAAMLVTADGLHGTIGGGTLEWQAIAAAREALARGADRLDRHALGPGLGQCCGGAVTLLTEIWDAERLAGLVTAEAMARPLPGVAGEMPLSVARRLARARSRGEPVAPGIVGDWFVEPFTRSRRPVWVWGAGHVGRAIVGVLAPLPGIEVTWIDTARDRFPATIPDGVHARIDADPGRVVAEAPPDAEHLVLTFSHALDLDLCHRILSRDFAHLGLIGSATKAARFRSRLRALGHDETGIARLECPIGDPTLGKHPQEIALGVGAALLSRRQGGTAMRRPA